jgi:hypothetical protein
MTRRKFIILATFAFFSAVVIWPLLGNFDQLIKKILLSDLGNAKIKPGDLYRFLDDAKKQNLWSQFTLGKKLLIRFHFAFENRIINLPYHHKYLHYKNIIMEEFLMSTDLVLNGMDASREIKYLGLFNPYKRYCFNPFSDTFHPQSF